MDPSETVVTCALCPAKHTNTIVCDDLIAVFARDASMRPTLHATAVAARLMALGDAETAARELAAVRGQTVEAWREELTHDRNTAARAP